VALAVAGGHREEVEQIAASLPDHERCLRFWAETGSAAPPPAQTDLTGPVFLDVYGLWQRETSGSPPQRRTALGPTVEPAPPPWEVAWLLEREATAEAAGEWRRIRTARGTTGSEGLAEADLAERRGRRNEAISVLREAFPDLGTVAMERAPGNAVLAYLPLPWSAEVRAAAAEFGIEPWLVAAVARQESGFVPHARSPRGAIGVMQLLPGTARGHALALGLGGRPDLEQPVLNLRLGSRELGRLLDAFGEVEPALAAYNAGESRVRRWWREAPDRFRFTEAIPIPETYGYVRRVRFLAEAYRVAYDHEWRMSP
jgi:soluble lytic murein transglycosylase